MGGGVIQEMGYRSIMLQGRHSMPAFSFGMYHPPVSSFAVVVVVVE